MPRVHRVISLLKRWLIGTHQGAVSHKHLEDYLDEFTFRFNRRRSQSLGQAVFPPCPASCGCRSCNLRPHGSPDFSENLLQTTTCRVYLSEGVYPPYLILGNFSELAGF